MADGDETGHRYLNLREILLLTYLQPEVGTKTEPKYTVQTTTMNVSFPWKSEGCSHHAFPPHYSPGPDHIS